VAVAVGDGVIPGDRVGVGVGGVGVGVGVAHGVVGPEIWPRISPSGKLTEWMST
jgi:hypothetical protein